MPKTVSTTGIALLVVEIMRHICDFEAGRRVLATAQDWVTLELRFLFHYVFLIDTHSPELQANDLDKNWVRCGSEYEEM